MAQPVYEPQVNEPITFFATYHASSPGDARPSGTLALDGQLLHMSAGRVGGQPAFVVPYQFGPADAFKQVIVRFVLALGPARDTWSLSVPVSPGGITIAVPPSPTPTPPPRVRIIDVQLLQPVGSLLKPVRKVRSGSKVTLNVRYRAYGSGFDVPTGRAQFVVGGKAEAAKLLPHTGMSTFQESWMAPGIEAKRRALARVRVRLGNAHAVKQTQFIVAPLPPATLKLLRSGILRQVGQRLVLTKAPAAGEWTYLFVAYRIDGRATSPPSGQFFITKGHTLYTHGAMAAVTLRHTSVLQGVPAFVWIKMFQTKALGHHFRFYFNIELGAQRVAGSIPFVVSGRSSTSA